MKTNKIFPVLAGISYATIFGLSFIFAKMLLDTMRPMEVLAARFIIAALSMEFLRLIKVLPIDLKGKKLKTMLLLSIFQPILYFGFEIIAIDMTSASLSGLMTSLTPIIVSFLSVIFLKEKLKIQQWAFIILSVAGVILINLMKGVTSSGSFWGMFFLLLTVSVAAIYNILAKKVSESLNPIEMTYIMMWVGALVFNAINLVNILINKNLSGYLSSVFRYEAILPLLYLGVLSSIVAFSLSIYTISKLPVSQAAIFGNFITIVSIVGGLLILKEPFHWYDFIGALMIIVGVWGTLALGNGEKNNPKEENNLETMIEP